MTDNLHSELQDWLDRWANTFLADDLDTFINMSDVPLSIRSHGAEWVVNKKEEFAAGFTAYRNMILNNKVDLIVRVLREAQTLPDGCVKVLYENYLMNGAQRVFRPSGAEAYLRPVNGSWKAYRVIDIEFGSEDQKDLPELRVDKLHDKVVRERLLALRPAKD